MSLVTRASSERDVLIATLYGEARNEPNDIALEGIVWVIKNRAAQNNVSWGGNRLRDVCMHPFQNGHTEVWFSNPTGITLGDEAARERCAAIVDKVLASNEDPTQGSDHYSKQLFDDCPEWAVNFTRTRRYGTGKEKYQFYRSTKI